MPVKINNKIISYKPGQTIMEAARAAGIKIPALCQHPDLKVKANCRVCAVEVKGSDKLQTACSTICSPGLEIQTDSPRAKRARKTNLELLFAEHAERCATCSLRYSCELLKLAREYKLNILRFKDRKKKRKTYRFANAVEIDGSQCIDCRNCIEACDKQKISYLEMKGSGTDQEVVPVLDGKSACIYCGQCALHCPVAAAQEQAAWHKVEALLKDKSRIAVAQFAPSVRVSIGEEFGLKPGTNCEGQTYTALKKLGFKYVFDINFGADITTITEAEELLERLKNKKAVFPMTTACCPAWVAYAEQRHPELLPNLTSARSPHIHSAGAIKSYWAKKKGIDPKKIVIVSVVPCTAKKYEAARPELTYKGRPLVDLVITTREFAFLLHKNNIDLAKLPEGKGESLFNEGSGASAIYGASGGVMESALRSANALACGDKTSCDRRLEFKEVRGLAGFKEATVDLAGKKIRVGVVNGIGHFPSLLSKLKKYHYIEVMACPGGCLGGGGQPLNTTEAVRQERLKGLYAIDSKRPVRRAHENEAMMKYYNFAKSAGLGAKLLHTKYKKTKGSVLKVEKKSGILPGLSL